jgi:hypothetical protein
MKVFLLSEFSSIPVMHAGSFFANRRRRAENGPAWRRSAA